MGLYENYSSFIDSIYENSEEVDKLKEIIAFIEDKELNKIKQVVLIGEMKYKSLRKVSPKLLYADPTKLTYKFIGKNTQYHSISVDDGEYRFTLNRDDAKTTICIVRSGYKNPNVHYLIKSIIDLGILTLNDPEYVNISNDKSLIAKNLSKYNIPQPKYAIIENSDIHKGDSTLLDIKLKSIYKDSSEDSKYVCKLLNGHGGKGVFLCSGKNIVSILQCMFAIDKDAKILVQEYIEIEEGDIRVHVLTVNGKQKILDSSMRKKGSSDFRTNLSLGNSQISDFKLTKEQEALAKNCAKASGLVWCGVDILPMKNGKNVIIEYNGAPGPPTELTGTQKELEQGNEMFFAKLLKTIDNMM